MQSVVQQHVNNELRNLMRWNYCGISRCNFILESKENEINFASKATIIARHSGSTILSLDLNNVFS